MVVRLPDLRALGADVPLSGPSHRDAVGQAGGLRGDGQRRDLVRRGGHEPGPRARARLFRPRRARSVRRGPGLVPRRPRPAHPAPGSGPGARAHRDVGRRGDRGLRQSQRLPGARTPRSSSSRSCSSSPSGSSPSPTTGSGPASSPPRSPSASPAAFPAPGRAGPRPARWRPRLPSSVAPATSWRSARTRSAPR